MCNRCTYMHKHVQEAVQKMCKEIISYAHRKDGMVETGKK